MAGAHLTGIGFAVDAALTARLELEMLHRIGDVNLCAVDIGLLQDAVEQPAGRADERFACYILLVSGLLADENHTRFLPAFAEHGLRCVLPERAASAGDRKSTRLNSSHVKISY